MRIAVAKDGIVENVVEGESVAAISDVFPDADIFEAHGVDKGWTFDGMNWVPPVTEPLLEPATGPTLYAAAQLKITDGDITGIGVNSRFAAAFWGDIGKYYVFFGEPLPDTSYMVMATAGLCSAYVLDDEKEVDFFVITVTNAAGEPSDASSVNLSVVRAN